MTISGCCGRNDDGMRRSAVFILCLVLFIFFSVPVMAECTEKLSVTDLFFEATVFLEDILTGKFIDYTIEDGNRVYMKDEFIAVQLPQE